MKEIKRHSAAHKKWINEVLKRDKYICQWCHCLDDLVAHHIKEWEPHPELRLELSNGLTLCRTCHMRHHKNNKGKKLTSTKERIRTGVGWPKGKKFTEMHKLKLSIRKLGKSTWNKGIPMREETKEKQRLINKGRRWIIDPESGKRKWID